MDTSMSAPTADGAMTSTQSLSVEKRDGSMQPFDRSKVSHSCVSAGATPELGDMIASRVEEWAMGAAVNGAVKSTEIRTMVLNNLRMESPDAASAFEAHVKAA